MASGRLVTVARAGAVPPGTAQPVRAGEVELALVNVGGTLYATQPRCPHLGGPLGHGRLENRVLTCPWHGWQFDVTTGENEFDRAITIETCPVLVEDGEVKVAL